MRLFIPTPGTVLKTLSICISSLLLIVACDHDHDRSNTPLAIERKPCTFIPRGVEPGPTGSEPLRLELIAEDLEIPWDIAFLPDGDMLLTERVGRLRLIHAGELQASPLLEIEVADITTTFNFEGGLLGLLLHPDFADNRLFYLYVTVEIADDVAINRILRYNLAPDNQSVSFDRVILDNIPAGYHHHGGRMKIGPDGKLYVGVGAFEALNAQKPDSLAGKLLRMNLDGSIPDDNPDPTSYVYISGIRNTQGYDWFDDDYLLIMDHGPTALDAGVPLLIGYDEFNVARAGDNLGWPEIWGCDSAAALSEPVLSWEYSVPPSGAVYYQGDAIPAWKGSFIFSSLGFFGDTNAEHLQRIELNPDNPYDIRSRHVYLQNQYGRLRSLSMDAQGQLYVMTSNCDARGFCPATRDALYRVSVEE